MDLRKEYTRLRANILKREKRIIEKGYGSYIPKVNLKKASELTDKQISTALKKAKRYDKSVTSAKVEERRGKRRERYELSKAFKKDIRAGAFIKGVRKWLKLQGKPTNLINYKNYKLWLEYINYRTAISNEKDKYEFEKYVGDMANELTNVEKKASIEDVLQDFKDYMQSQQNFVEEAKRMLGESTSEYQRYYSSDAIMARYFDKGKK